MKALIVNYHDFDSPSGMHIFNLANNLGMQGVECHVYNTGGTADGSLLYGKQRFHSYALNDIKVRELLSRLSGDFVIHTWTPRERPRIITELIRKYLDAPVIVHMEDNEDEIVKNWSKNYLPAGHILTDADWEQPGSPLNFWSHPVRSHEFMASAQGYTCIIEELLDFKPKNIPGIFFWPACEENFFNIPQSSSPKVKMDLGLDPSVPVIFYPGAMHSSNMEDIVNLYLAVDMINSMGIRLNIIKFGNYNADIEEDILKRKVDWILDLTKKVPPSELPKIMQAADILVQPGNDNAFNHYRFPCKLPMFMASGRPLIMGKSNLGNRLSNHENCMLLDDSGCMELSANIRYLINNPEQALRIGAAGREFAKQNFSWKKSAEKVQAFYAEVLESWKQNKQVKI